MKKLLLITGDLATGKSTFAGALSQRYDAAVFYKDAIKEVLGDTVGFSNREENLKLSRATMEIMCYLFSQCGKVGNDLILEANFHTAELEKLHRLAKDREYSVLTLVLRGDPERLHKRYLYRIRNQNRHPVHLSTTMDIFADFQAYLEAGRKESIPGNRIEINADNFSYQTDEAVLGSIDAFMRG
ncbi:MAG: hypothetical protein ACI4A8_00900 [Muribaculaceae bacterium]